MIRCDVVIKQDRFYWSWRRREWSSIDEAVDHCLAAAQDLDRYRKVTIEVSRIGLVVGGDHAAPSDYD